MKTLLLKISVAGAAMLAAILLWGQQRTPAQPDDTRAYFEILRSEFNTHKVATLNDILKLKAEEAEKFWPVYRQYEKELATLGDRKLELYREFCGYHFKGTLTDDKAQQLAERWLANLQDRIDLWKKYHQQISRAVSPTRAAQFLQVENQIALFIDLSIASDMPAITPAKNNPSPSP